MTRKQLPKFETREELEQLLAEQKLGSLAHTILQVTVREGYPSLAALSIASLQHTFNFEPLAASVFGSRQLGLHGLAEADVLAALALYHPEWLAAAARQHRAHPYTGYNERKQWVTQVIADHIVRLNPIHIEEAPASD